MMFGFVIAISVRGVRDINASGVPRLRAWLMMVLTFKARRQKKTAADPGREPRRSTDLLRKIFPILDYTPIP